jgi:peptidoglycan/xylan/chitin deacetylase (PgdA/CDA1 family)
VIRRTYFRALDLAGLDRFLLRRHARSRSVLVLNLHRVSPRGNPFWPPLHPDLFNGLLSYLQQRCDVTSLARLEEEHPAATERPRVVLSFDDGYADFVAYAMPLLERYRMSANQNIVPSCVETGEPPLNVRIYDYLASAPISRIRRLRVPGFAGNLRGEDEVAKQSYGAALSRFFKERPAQERDASWSAFMESMAGVEPARPTSMMSLADVHEAAQNHEIGAHSYTHQSMEFVSDSFFLDDLGRCERFFTDHLGAAPTIYSFPNGSYRTQQLDLLRSKGFKHILLVGERPSPSDATVRTRLTVTGTSSSEVLLRALGHRPRRFYRRAI